ncbi:hypothetical protein SESBI_25589 [Sesbania bispinosa]|nr:hypothetical protein SESBI_25589 [Sesbania bispinosa]
MDLVSVGFHKVAILCGRRENWRLQVKLIRLWKMSAVATPDGPFAMHMLFVDQELAVVVEIHTKRPPTRKTQMILPSTPLSCAISSPEPDNGQ